MLMKSKNFWGGWICILFFASSFAQVDTSNLIVQNTDSSNIAKNDNKDSTKVSSKTDAINLGKAYFGAASYYAKKFEGRKTATGEIFHHKNFTAANNNFKLNSWVKVTNLKTGKCVIVRINDRMSPSMSKKGRIVDLSYTAAKEIGILNSGTGKVKVEQISIITD